MGHGQTIKNAGRIVSKDKTVLEKEIIDKIQGVGYSGMESGYAFTSFLQNYYENIQDTDEQAAVCGILMDLLKNDHFDAIFRGKVAWISADIPISGIEEELKKLLKEPALSAAVSRELMYILRRFKLESKMKEIIETGKYSSKIDVEDMVSAFQIKLFDQLENPSEKSDVINLLIKFIRSNLGDQVFRIKTAWVMAYLGVSSIKEEIRKLSADPSWKESAYRSSLDDISRFISERKK